MYLIFGIFIGILYGRNAREVNQKTYEDIQKAWRSFAKTPIAFDLYLLADSMYERIARLRMKEVVYTHDILCPCNHRNCLGYTPSIATYTRKIKAAV